MVAVVSDRDDGGQGQEGAAELARKLALAVRRVRVIQPPDEVKDARAWRNAGATRSDVLDAIAAAPPVRLSIRTRSLDAAPAGEVDHVR